MSKTLLSVPVALLLAFSTATSYATPAADICYGPSIALGAVQPSTSATQFSCPLAGTHTLAELAALGWTVVQLLPVQNSASTMADQLVIQRL